MPQCHRHAGCWWPVARGSILGFRVRLFRRGVALAARLSGAATRGCDVIFFSRFALPFHFLAGY